MEYKQKCIRGFVGKILITSSMTQSNSKTHCPSSVTWTVNCDILIDIHHTDISLQIDQILGNVGVVQTALNTFEESKYQTSLEIHL